MLFADSIKTFAHVRDGFETLNIVGKVPTQVDYGNAANGMSIEVDNAFKNYDCHLCAHLGHISGHCPGPLTNPPLPRANDRSYGRGNQRGRGYGGGGPSRNKHMQLGITWRTRISGGFITLLSAMGSFTYQLP